MLLLLFLVVSAQNSANQNSPLLRSGAADVCILGAGAAGMASAAFLQDRGYSVAIFEKDDEVGGSCNTYRFTSPAPGWLDFGVLLFPDTAKATAAGVGVWDIDTKAFVERFAGPNSTIPIDFASSFAAPTASINFQTGATSCSSPADPTAVYTAFVNYGAKLNTIPWLTTYDYPDVLPSWLLDPFSKFIQDNNLQGMQELFDEIILPGLGNTSSFATLTGITQLNQLVLWLVGTSGGGFIVNNGCKSIYEGILSYLATTNTPILLNSTLTYTLRTASGLPNLVTGYNSYTHQPFAYSCEKIISAFPQTSEAMGFMGMDALETEVFSHVSGSQYFSGVLNVNSFNINGSTTGPFAINNRDQNNLICQPDYPAMSSINRYLPYGPAAFGFAGQQSQFFTEASASSVINQELSNLNSTFQGSLLLIDGHTAETKGFRPRFSNDILSATPNGYTLLKNLQGHRNTYYTGQLVTTAGSFAVWNQALKLIQTFFPSKI